MNTYNNFRIINLQLDIETWVDRDGTIETRVYTMDGGAKHTENGTLTNEDGWVIRDSSGYIIVMEKAKKDAITTFEKQAAQKAAKWAIG